MSVGYLWLILKPLGSLSFNLIYLSNSAHLYPLNSFNRLGDCASNRSHTKFTASSRAFHHLRGLNMVCLAEDYPHSLWFLSCCILIPCDFIASHSKFVQEFFKLDVLIKSFGLCNDASVALICDVVLLKIEWLEVWEWVCVEPHLPCARPMCVASESTTAIIAFWEACDPHCWWMVDGWVVSLMLMVLVN